MLQFVVLIIFVSLAAGLAWFLIAHDRGQKEPIGALWLAAGLGLLAAVLAGLIEARLTPVANMLPGTSYGLLLRTTMTVGIIEEACKFAPLALVLYKRRYFNEYTDGVIYFALAGLGFGLPENLLYTLQFGAKAGFARLFLTPVFHAATTGLVGYYLIKFKLEKRSPAGVAVPLIAAMVLHGLYDFGLTSGSLLYAGLSLLVTLGLGIALFMAFVIATEHDRARGMSAVGHNAFCRSCGYPNPDHYLYCVHCGKNA